LRRERPRGRRAAEQCDEVAAFQLIELHSVPSQGRIAEYRIGNDQSGGVGGVRDSRRLGAPGPSFKSFHTTGLPGIQYGTKPNYPIIPYTHWTVIDQCVANGGRLD
jgi:hypothetical protein